MPRVVDIEQRRTELTDATARVIARSGIEAATMREIAAEAGWTTGALTHYFADKHDLLLATFQASLAARRSRRADRVGDIGDRPVAGLAGGRAPPRRRPPAALAGDARLLYAGERRRAARRRPARRLPRVPRTTSPTSYVNRGSRPARTPMSAAERLIAIVDGVAVQALFDPQSWPPQRQLAALAATPTAPTVSLWRR